MNFAELLEGTKSASCEKIAAEIINLEARIPELEKARQETSDSAMRLRQRALAGEAFPDGDVESAGSAEKEASRGRAAARRAIEELKALLLKTAENERPEKIKELEEYAHAMMSEGRERRAELIREFAAFFIKWHEIEGGHSETYYFELDGRSSGDPEVRGILRKEIERLNGGPLPMSRGLRGEAEQMLRKAGNILNMTSHRYADKVHKEVQRTARKEAEKSDKKEDE